MAHCHEQKIDEATRSHRPIALINTSFFFYITASTELYTLSLHDALPISCDRVGRADSGRRLAVTSGYESPRPGTGSRSEEHTSELQSRRDLVCRLLLEKKNSGRAAASRRSTLLRARTARRLASMPAITIE